MLNSIKLSDHLKIFRTDRPDEWKMDEFIMEAKILEEQMEKDAKLIPEYISEVLNCDSCKYKGEHEYLMNKMIFYEAAYKS